MPFQDRDVHLGSKFSLWRSAGQIWMILESCVSLICWRKMSWRYLYSWLWKVARRKIFWGCGGSCFGGTGRYMNLFGELGAKV